MLLQERKVAFCACRNEVTNFFLKKQLAVELRNALRVKGMDLLEDKRQCALCGQYGDGELDSCGRLLNADANTWVHVNCALWSEEVGVIVHIEIETYIFVQEKIPFKIRCFSEIF